MSLPPFLEKLTYHNMHTLNFEKKLPPFQKFHPLPPQLDHTNLYLMLVLAGRCRRSTFMPLVTKWPILLQDTRHIAQTPSHHTLTIRSCQITLRIISKRNEQCRKILKLQGPSCRANNTLTWSCQRGPEWRSWHRHESHDQHTVEHKQTNKQTAIAFTKPNNIQKCMYRLHSGKIGRQGWKEKANRQRIYIYQRYTNYARLNLFKLWDTYGKEYQQSS